MAKLVLAGAIWHTWKERNHRVIQLQKQHKICVFRRLYKYFRVLLRICNWKSDREMDMKLFLSNWNVWSYLAPAQGAYSLQNQNCKETGLCRTSSGTGLAETRAPALGFIEPVPDICSNSSTSRASVTKVGCSSDKQLAAVMFSVYQKDQHHNISLWDWGLEIVIASASW